MEESGPWVGMHFRCSDCKQLTAPAWMVHICTKAQEMNAYKRWNFETNSWDIQPDRGTGNWHHFQGIAYWDAKAKGWFRDYTLVSKVDMELVHKMYKEAAIIEALRAKPAAKEEKVYEVASCELPVRLVKASEPTVERAVDPKTYGKGYNAWDWDPVRPWENVDRNRWPSTWNKLVQLYFHEDWNKYQQGKYISNGEYRDRIYNKIYKPETKSSVVTVNDDDAGNPYVYGWE